MSAKHPLDWLNETDPAEIAEALLSVDTGKAAAVALYVTERLGAEIGAIATRFEQQLNEDPTGTLGKMLGGALRGLMGG